MGCRVQFVREKKAFSRRLRRSRHGKTVPLLRLRALRWARRRSGFRRTSRSASARRDRAACHHVRSLLRNGRCRPVKGKTARAGHCQAIQPRTASFCQTNSLSRPTGRLLRGGRVRAAGRKPAAETLNWRSKPAAEDGTKPAPAGGLGRARRRSFLRGTRRFPAGCTSVAQDTEAGGVLLPRMRVSRGWRPAPGARPRLPGIRGD